MLVLRAIWVVEWKDLSHYVVAIEEKDGSPGQARG